MLEDLYLMAVVAMHKTPEGPQATPNRVRARLMPRLKQWGGRYLRSVTVAGSYAKGTAIRGATMAPQDVDVDLFLSLAAEAPGALADYQATLVWQTQEYQPKMANVSVKILVEHTPVDLTVGRRVKEGEDHTLWQQRRGAPIRTNVAEQIRYVRESGCLNEILATKIWKRKQALYFPSFCLELSVIEALGQGDKGEGLAARVKEVLGYLAGELPSAALRDPANRSNVVSDLMTEEEKWRVANAAWMELRAD